jgi:hypothetical protein
MLLLVLLVLLLLLRVVDAAWLPLPCIMPLLHPSPSIIPARATSAREKWDI